MRTRSGHVIINYCILVYIMHTHIFDPNFQVKKLLIFKLFIYI